MIKVKNLVKIYKSYKKKGFFRKETKKIVALNKISFKIKKGERVALIGPNGAGKTTTIKILTGILYPTEGEVKVLNYIPWKDRIKLNREISVLFTSSSKLYFSLPAIDTFEFLKEIYKIREKAYKSRLNYLVNLFGAEDLIKIPVRNLSFGERMKLELIASLLHAPKILFLDEPTIGLDVVAKDAVRKLLKEVNKKFKTTILLTSHDLQDVEKVCERVIIISKGNLIYDGSLSDLFKKYVKYKVIEVELEKVPRAITVNGEVKLQGKRAIIKVNREEHKEVVVKLLEKYKVRDIKVKEESLEDIIKRIYSE